MLPSQSNLYQPQPPRDTVSSLPVAHFLSQELLAGLSVGLASYYKIVSALRAACQPHPPVLTGDRHHGLKEGHALGLWKSHTYIKLSFSFFKCNNAHFRGSLRIKRQSSWPNADRQ